MKFTKNFERWYNNAKHPQGNYKFWQHTEFKDLAYRAWKAGVNNYKKKNTITGKGMISGG